MLILEIVSFILAFYFLIIEIIKIVGFCKMTNRKAFARKKYFETIWEFASPIMIMVVQIWSSIVGVKGLNRRYWELVAWTSFVLWVRFLLMLRIKKHISSSITMIFNSFKKMGPYIIIVVIGVLCFSNVFTAIR